MDLLHIVNPEDSCEQVYFSIHIYRSNIYLSHKLLDYLP